MNEAIVVAIIATGVALAAFGLAACMFWRGSWLVLLAGSAAADGAHDDAHRKLGRRMAAVLAVAAALMATLAAR